MVITNCLQSNRIVTSFISNNPIVWMHETIESCENFGQYSGCSWYYSWNKNICCINSGEDCLNVGSGMWYVSWKTLICVKNCSVASGVKCGGFASKWDMLYETDDEYCASKQSWLDCKHCTHMWTIKIIVHLFICCIL